MAFEELERKVQSMHALVEGMMKVPPPRMYEQSESIKNLATAMVKAQAAMDDPERAAENTFFSNQNKRATYADLGMVRAAIRKPLADAGICYFQFPFVDYDRMTAKKVFRKAKDGQPPSSYDVQVPVVSVVTKLVHGESGEWVSVTLSAIPSDDTPPAIGSVVTYCRRYGLKAIVGLADEDDDGNAGAGRDGKNEDKKPAAPTPQKPAAPAPQNPKMANLQKPADIKDAKGRVRWVAAKHCFDDIIQNAEGLISTAEYMEVKKLVEAKILDQDGIPKTKIFCGWLKGVYGVEFFDIKKEMLTGIKITLNQGPKEIQDYRVQ